MAPALRVLLAGVLFASGGALLKACEFPSLQRAALRALFAAVTLFAVLPQCRRWPDRRIALLLPAYFGATCLFVVANALTTAANAIFLQSTAPLWLAVLGPLLLRERTSRRDALVLVGVAAGMTLCFVAPTGAVATATDPALGDLVALASGVCYALLLIGLRWLSRATPGQNATAIAWGNVFTFPVALVLMPAVGQTPIAGSAQDWAVIVFLGACQIGAAYALLATALAHVPAVRASLLLMIEPVLNPLIAYFVHGERPHVLTLLGGATILGAVAGGNLLRRRR